MVLILTDIHDGSALWAHGRLHERGIPVELVTAAALGAAKRWEHRVCASVASIACTLPDGRVISSDDKVGVLNRLTRAPVERLNRVAGADLDYAVQEMNAFFLSWLNVLPGPVFNRPTPQGLGGAWRHPSMWSAMATRAGLPASPWRQSSEDPPFAWWAMRPPTTTVFVVGSRVVLPPEAPPALSDGCRRLAVASGTALLGIDFAPNADQVWQVVDASPVPDLTRGGDDLADALAEALSA